MDHFSKALEHARRDGTSVRTWVQPSAELQEPAARETGAGRAVELDPEQLRAKRVLAGHGIEDPVVADKYRLLRTQVVQRMRANGWTRLAITSPGPKAGKTLTSLNLAISTARNGNQRVTLVDADLRKPSVAEDLGLEVDAGLMDYLQGAASMEEVAFTSASIPNLTIVPGRRPESGDAKPELLGSERMRRFLDQTARSRDPALVIVDLPPVFVGDDVIKVGESIDAVLMVIEEGSTDVEDLERALEMLGDNHLIGTVLNKSLEKSSKLGGYYYAYSAGGGQ